MKLSYDYTSLINELKMDWEYLDDEVVVVKEPLENYDKAVVVDYLNFSDYVNYEKRKTDLIEKMQKTDLLEFLEEENRLI